jgi:hypothetical protein
VPGDEGGEIDPEKLRAWVTEVRHLAKQQRRVAAMESKIGKILALAPRQAGIPWPPEAARQIIETSQSEELENGFIVAVGNARGVTVRKPTDGGSLEREEAAFYRLNAKSLPLTDLRTRALLNRLAQSYEKQADTEDQGAEQRDWRG